MLITGRTIILYVTFINYLINFNIYNLIPSPNYNIANIYTINIS